MHKLSLKSKYNILNMYFILLFHYKNIGCMWRGIKTIPIPQEFYHARSTPPIPKFLDLPQEMYVHIQDQIPLHDKFLEKIEHILHDLHNIYCLKNIMFDIFTASRQTWSSFPGMPESVLALSFSCLQSKMGVIFHCCLSKWYCIKVILLWTNKNTHGNKKVTHDPHCSSR